MESIQDLSEKLKKLKMAQDQKILRIVCSGGGAKGAVYPGAYKAMEDTGLLAGVKAFSGSSAGAITAAFMAIGVPTSVLRNALLTTNFKKLIGKGVGSFFFRNKPGVSFLTKDGSPLEQFIRTLLIERVASFLTQLESPQDIASQHPDFKALLHKFEVQSNSITFGDLGVLNRLFPHAFKRLIIPAVKFPHGELQIFNEDLTPDVDIALACRASSSIPVIFEPVEIAVDGKKQKFIDSGIYDNLPTDYFDTSASGKHIKNTIPQQTLVLAFGEGLDNRKNKLSHALYGPRWDEVIGHRLLTQTIERAIYLAKKRVAQDVVLHRPEKESVVIKLSVQKALNQLLHHGRITMDKYTAVMRIVNQSMDSIYLKPKSNGAFWRAYQKTRDEKEQVILLCTLVREKMKPILCHQSALSSWRKNFLIKRFAELEIGYQHQEKKERGYQRIRRDYTLRTVELRVGNIDTLDFNKATKFARVIDTLGYLDTIDFISSHELHEPSEFSTDDFYNELVNHYDHIHTALLCASGHDRKSNALLAEIVLVRHQLAIKNQPIEVISRQVYQLIKDYVEKHMNSPEAFALSRAVEFRNHVLSAEKLLKETYEEGFKYRGFFATSKIMGVRFYRSSTLHEALKDKDMATVYAQKAHHIHPTRSDKLLVELQQIPAFREAYVG